MHSPCELSTIPYRRALPGFFALPVVEVVVICTTAPASANATHPAMIHRLVVNGPAP
jgi:hypothetical protein